MKLYYSPGACSMASNIVAHELGLTLELEKVNLREHLTESGEDYYAINPKGYIPALVLDDGQLLTEGVAIMQYLADLKPEANLVPDRTSFERYRLQEWLTFVNSEVHKMLGALFAPNLEEARKQIIIERSLKRLEFVDKHLATNKYLMGEQYTVADSYLFTVVSWSKMLNVDITALANLNRFLQEVGSRPAVIQTMQSEGLI
jgi:glutathione S-transferase